VLGHQRGIVDLLDPLEGRELLPQSPQARQVVVSHRPAEVQAHQDRVSQLEVPLEDLPGLLGGARSPALWGIENGQPRQKPAGRQQRQQQARQARAAVSIHPDQGLLEHTEDSPAAGHPWKVLAASVAVPLEG
jgi:hypothetical protein